MEGVREAKLSLSTPHTHEQLPLHPLPLSPLTQLTPIACCPPQQASWLSWASGCPVKCFQIKAPEGLPTLPGQISPLSASLMVPEFLPSALHSKGQSTAPCAHGNGLEKYGSCVIKRRAQAPTDDVLASPGISLAVSFPTGKWAH